MLIAFLWVGFGHSPLVARLEVGPLRALASVALVFAPLWFCGLVRFERLKRLPGWLKIALAGLLSLPYYALRAGSVDFHWTTALALTAFPVLTAAFLELSRLPPAMTWRDGFVLGLIAAIYYLNLPAGAWPRELRFFSKLYLADVVLYSFLLIRKLAGSGYSLLPSRSALAIGLREWTFFAPIAVAIAEMLGFIQFRPGWPGWGKLVADLIVTVLLIAIPEELFFRAVLENLLETRLPGYGALVVASLLFGLSHFNHGARFNWRYVLLAAIAGVFYGRAWRARRQIFASLVTHTAVDVVWSLWFR
jgi:membrane protease YdiL (CAAX protease family)